MSTSETEYDDGCWTPQSQDLVATDTSDESWKNASRSQSPLSELPLEVELGSNKSSYDKGEFHDDVPTTPTFDTFDRVSYDLDDDDNSSPYKCDLCSRSFPNIIGLKTHKRSHTRQPDVSSIPTNKVPIEREKNRRDNPIKQLPPRREAPINSTPELSHPCGQCTESYSCGSDLHAHVTRVHGPYFEEKNTLPTWKVSSKEKPKRKRSKRVEPYYWKDGLFYVCKYCGKSHLHIVGFRSHWKRHERENGVTSDTLKSISIPILHSASQSITSVTLPLIDLIE